MTCTIEIRIVICTAVAMIAPGVILTLTTHLTRLNKRKPPYRPVLEGLYGVRTFQSGVVVGGNVSRVPFLRTIVSR